MNVLFTRLISPTADMAAAFTKWDNDPALVHLMRPNHSQADLERVALVDVEELTKRLEHQTAYLLYLEEQLVGEMSYQVDPPHLYKKEPGTAWIGITIGEESARGKGLGTLAMQHLEEEIKKAGFNRIELGVFEFNEPAQKLYQRMRYIEIGRIPEFTLWQNKMWTDIRMEKYI